MFLDRFLPLKRPRGEKQLKPRNIIEAPKLSRPVLIAEGGKVKSRADKIENRERIDGYEVIFHGEDASIYNPDTGTAVVIDGISSGQRQTTLEIVKKLAVKLMKILESERIDFNPNELLTELDNIEGAGGAMVLGARYLPETDQLILVDIGNCQAALGSGNTFTDIKINPAVKTGRREPVAVIKPKARPPKLNDDRPSVQQSYLQVIDLKKWKLDHGIVKDKGLTLLLGSDGYEESVGKNLVQAAPVIKQLGIERTVQAIDSKDDITIIMMELTPSVAAEKVAA